MRPAHQTGPFAAHLQAACGLAVLSHLYSRKDA